MLSTTLHNVCHSSLDSASFTYNALLAMHKEFNDSKPEIFFNESNESCFKSSLSTLNEVMADIDAKLKAGESLRDDYIQGEVSRALGLAGTISGYYVYQPEI